MFFEDQDIETAGKVLILPSIWMRLMNEFITDRFAERQTEFNAMPEAEQMKENGCEYKQSNWILLA